MKDYNREYVKLLEKLRNIKGKNQKEEELLKLLENVVYLDTNNKIILSMLEEDSNLNKLMYSINEEIDRLRRRVDDSLKYKRDGGSISKNQDKLFQYVELKNKIIDLYAGQLIDSSDKDLLIEKCYEEIKKCYSNPVCMGRNLIDYTGEKYQVNREGISLLYSLVQDKEFINEVREGVCLLDKEIKINGSLRDCKDVLSKKDVLVPNSDLIIKFNSYIYMLEKYKEELNSSKYKNLNGRINELNRRITKESIKSNDVDYYLLKRDLLFSRVDRIEEIKRNSVIIKRKMNSIYQKLCGLGLEELLFDTYTKNIGDGVLNISKTLRELDSKEELEEYFDNIELEKNKNLNELSKVLDDKEKYMKTAGIHTLDFVHNHFLSAKTLVNIDDKDKDMEISPRLAVFILKTISESEKKNSRDIDISDYEYEDLERWYEDNLLKDIHELEDEFYGIYFDVNKRDNNDINSNKSSTRLKK